MWPIEFQEMVCRMVIVEQLLSNSYVRTYFKAHVKKEGIHGRRGGGGRPRMSRKRLI